MNFNKHCVNNKLKLQLPARRYPLFIGKTEYTMLYEAV